MLIYKDGITRSIDDIEWQTYKDLGYKEVSKPKPKPKAVEEIEEETTPKKGRGRGE